jgi:hypothetical protein
VDVPLDSGRLQFVVQGVEKAQDVVSREGRGHG